MPHFATALSIIVSAFFAFSPSHASTPGTRTVPPETALHILQNGNARFVKNSISAGKPTAARRTETAKAQHPFAIIVACSDSRTPPELLFDQNLGDLFVVRSAGNLVDNIGLGSIEYAVEHLGARLVVVLGHERCGAVKAALESPTAPEHIRSILRQIQPAVKETRGMQKETRWDATACANAELTAKKIREKGHFGNLRDKVLVVRAFYDLDTGKVTFATCQ